MGTYGIMSMDSEVRCDYDKLRRDRLEKTRASMKKMGIGSLLVFEQDHIRYITGTKIGEWNHTIRNRYVLLRSVLMLRSLPGSRVCRTSA